MKATKTLCWLGPLVLVFAPKLAWADVRVVTVRTMRMPRKLRRVGRFAGHKPEWKKAIVQLAEGQTIEFFEGV